MAYPSIFTILEIKIELLDYTGGTVGSGALPVASLAGEPSHQAGHSGSCRKTRVSFLPLLVRQVTEPPRFGGGTGVIGDRLCLSLEGLMCGEREGCW